MSRLSRLAATARHLSARQLATRAVRIAQRRLWRLRQTPAPTPVPPPIRRHEPLWANVSADEATIARARLFVDERFTFLNVERTRPRWDQPDVSQLWRYHLHYFDYVRELAALPEHAIAFDAFRRLLTSWIEGNAVLVGDGWHPYTVSMRVVNWCEAADAFAEELARDEVFARRFLSSLYGQSRFLASHLEHDVRGNHLLKNLRALVWAGTFFDSAEAARWRERALDLLRGEVAEQVLADGGHFERVPGYHVQVLRDLEETEDYLKRNGVAADWLADAATRMRHFLGAITPTSGRLPLLKDSILADVPPSRGESRFLEASGLAVVRNDATGDFLIGDFGIVCPDYLPAHAHADMFSYELTIGGKAAVVDAGVYEYAPGQWRDWFRSTAAHNTVEVDGRNQSDVWGSFRVGRRARPSEVRWIERDGLIIVQGSHDGYAPAVHRRTIVAVPHERIWLFVDEVRGSAQQTARSFIHIHPDFTFGDEAHLTTFDARVGEERSWYSERFGEKVANRAIVLEALTPVCFGYVISVRADITVTARDKEIDLTAGEFSFRLALDTLR